MGADFACSIVLTAAFDAWCGFQRFGRWMRIFTDCAIGGACTSAHTNFIPNFDSLVALAACGPFALQLSLMLCRSWGESYRDFGGLEVYTYPFLSRHAYK